MSSSLRRGVTAAFFALSIAALAACGAGHDAETGEIRPDNAAAQVDDIKVQNVNVILADDGEGPGAVSARLFNESAEDQVLEAVRVADSGTAFELTPAEGESRVVVPAHGSVALGGEGNATARLEDPAAADVALGNAQKLVFLLSETGEISLSARVVADSDAFGHYEGWGATPTPEAPAEPEPPADDEAGADPSGEADPGAETEGAATEGTETEGSGEPADGETGETGATGETGETGTTPDESASEDPADDGLVED
ncbi:DUF461 domain-containing protein [Streptomyces litchfieldiae]|uniref:DUF461 domain-containing protein n=1 Tax=Streptomyces litchfieldiae TaxID=3075543 RepID=A0ABU2MNZ2_9ACTN|nr:DUF461 domain-containing protein [Streptomyces sp. DSM 44938]MDT0343337.1 DUF461 domain-containing protein [Streptomyces sp. DSM 44938]